MTTSRTASEISSRSKQRRYQRRGIHWGTQEILFFQPSSIFQESTRRTQKYVMMRNCDVPTSRSNTTPRQANWLVVDATFNVFDQNMDCVDGKVVAFSNKTQRYEKVPNYVLQYAIGKVKRSIKCPSTYGPFPENMAQCPISKWKLFVGVMEGNAYVVRC